MKINRRKFLSGAVVGAGGMMLGGGSLLAAAEPAPARASVDPYQMVTLGKSGVKASFIGMGTGSHASMRDSALKRSGKENFIKTVQYAWEKGIRFFDCADTYGSHQWVAEALAGKPRDQYLLTSKIWFRPGQLPEKDRPDADVVLTRFLKEINTDYIDVLQMHCMTDPAWATSLEKQMELMQKAKEKGMVRSHGVSVHNIDALRGVATTPWVDVLHTRVNAFGASMDAAPEVVLPVVKAIHGAGKGVIGMKLIGNGAFTATPEKIDQSLKYVLDQECVDAMIVGFTEMKQIDDFEARVRKALEARQPAKVAKAGRPLLNWARG